jgi:cytochrome b pre-mRNA-processing protein 3
MSKNSININTQEDILYNNILSLSRNKLFFTKFGLADTFQNRIYLIFIHISFLFIKIKQNNQKEIYKIFYQKMFDLIFKNIELNMREIGYGDIVTNKNMKFLVKTFYNILLNCENFNWKSINLKKMFFFRYLEHNNMKKKADNVPLIEYFDKYQAFCLDLSLDSVLKGDLNFRYK